MFGDKMLLGQYEVTVDDNRRMFLPSKTNSEKDDCLVLMYDSILNCYKIYNKRTLENKFKSLENFILTAKTEEEEKRYKIIFLNFCKSILKECVVDVQGRISLGSTFEPKEKLLLIGANDHLILERRNKVNN